MQIQIHVFLVNIFFAKLNNYNLENIKITNSQEIFGIIIIDWKLFDFNENKYLTFFPKMQKYSTYRHS